MSDDTVVGQRLVECPVCEAVGLPERIDDHDCSDLCDGDNDDDRMALRQFLSAAAVAVRATASTRSVEREPRKESYNVPHDTAEWKAASVWEDHLIPARTALTSSDGVDIETAEEELREAIQKLKALEVDDGN